IEFADEPEILDIKTKIKINQIKINIPQNCKGMLTEYELFKELASTLYGIIQIEDNKKENAILVA
ncbi:6487_t:CDS:2, partial [Cetraspora pellucida]